MIDMHYFNTLLIDHFRVAYGRSRSVHVAVAYSYVEASLGFSHRAGRRGPDPSDGIRSTTDFRAVP